MVRAKSARDMEHADTTDSPITPERRAVLERVKSFDRSKQRCISFLLTPSDLLQHHVIQRILAVPEI